MKIVVSDPIFLPEEYRKRLEVLGNLTILKVCHLPLMNLYQGLWHGETETRRFDSCSRDRSDVMAETIVIWEPTEWKSLCPYCNAKNLSNIPALHNVCTACGKEYMAKVAHTEED